MRDDINRLIIDLIAESVHELQGKSNYQFIAFKKDEFIKLTDSLSIIGVRVRYGNIEFAVVLNEDVGNYDNPDKLINRAAKLKKTCSQIPNASVIPWPSAFCTAVCSALQRRAAGTACRSWNENSLCRLYAPQDISCGFVARPPVGLSINLAQIYKLFLKIPKNPTQLLRTRLCGRHTTERTSMIGMDCAIS